MPVLGSGIVPAAGAIASELTAVTRRGFLDQMVVQIYNASPLTAALLDTAQTSPGGVSSISAPVQGQPFVTTQTTDYGGNFTLPAAQQGAFLAEFNLKAIITPIPFNGMEGALQIDHAIVPLLEARMNDSTNSMVDFMTNSLYNNVTDSLQMIGLNGAVDDGTNLVTYGNINRTANTWFQSKVYNAGAVAPTRNLMLQYISGVYKAGSEMPTFGLTGVGTWARLAQDFVANESYQLQPGKGFDTDADRPRSAFRALDVAGVPVFGDPNCPEGTVYLLNPRYLNLYVHPMAAFAFSGFESLIPNGQLGYVGVVLTLAELVVTKPKCCAKVTNFTFLSL